MDGTDGEAVDTAWLLARTRAVVRATTRETEPAAIADAATAALAGEEGAAWIGFPVDGRVRVRAGSVDLPATIASAAGAEPTASERALGDELLAFETLDANPEYQRLRETETVPEAATGLSVALGDPSEGYGVLHWYSGRDLTRAAVQETADEIAGLVTDALRAAERTRELDRERERLEQLRSTLSHDLGNPLNLGAGRLDLAREDCDSPHLDHVERAFDQIDALVDDGLTFVEASKPVESAEALSLGDIATDCWEHLGADRGSLTVTDQTVYADSERLWRLLSELFENALVHSDGAVEIWIETLDDGGFAVVDDGDGIPDDHREYVFDRGYSIDSERDGNGLAVVSAIARAHGWEATLADTADGTRVEIRTAPW